jgi:hypothetical protein
VRLADVENDDELMAIIKAAGNDCFERFLKSNGLVDPGRYASFKAGLIKIGRDQALAIGSEATIVAALLTNGSAKYIKGMRDWRTQHGGVMPTRETAKHILMQVDPRPEEPRASRQQDELARLRAENIELKAKLRMAEARIRELERKTPKPPEGRA